MRSERRQVYLHLLAVYFFIVVLAGCSRPSHPIRIATAPWPGYEVLHLAEKLGYFEDENVEVQLVEFFSLGDSTRAYERGQVDIWGATLVELILSQQVTTSPANAFLVADFSKGGDVILALEPITTVAQLKDRRIGLEMSTVNLVLLHQALAQSNLTLNDVELIAIPSLDMTHALKNGHVDAICTYPPVATVLMRESDVRVLFDSSSIPNLIMDVLAGRSSVIYGRKEEIAAITRAYFRAQAYIKQYPNDAYTIMASRLGVNLTELKQMMATIEMIPLGQQLEYLGPNHIVKSSFETTLHILQEANLTNDPLNVEDYFTDEFIR